MALMRGHRRVIIIVVGSSDGVHSILTIIIIGTIMLVNRSASISTIIASDDSLNKGMCTSHIQFFLFSNSIFRFNFD